MKKRLLSFGPLLLLLSLALLSRSAIYSESLIGDEPKFYTHAENIIQGFYTDNENPNLMEGPGYPLYLSVSAALDLPYFWTRASHIALIFFAALYLYAILTGFLKPRAALVFTYLFALYPPLLRWAYLMYAEAFTVFLLLGFCYHFIQWFQKEGNLRKHMLLSALFLGLLSLTKLIFPYVVLTALIGIAFFYGFPVLRERFQLLRVAIVLAGALIVITPYVVYAYQVTGKFMYMGMHGGSILYYRSTPFENEFGNWFSEWHVLKNEGPEMQKGVMVNSEKLRENHGAFISSIDTLSWMARDSVYKAKAIENMKAHPAKYAKNTAANVSRLFFHFPFSYRIQNMETLGYLIPNMFIIVLAVLGIYPAIQARRRLPGALVLLLIFSLIYLGGHSLLGGRGRFLIPVVPIWIAFFSYIYFRVLRISFRTPRDD